jgi:hypothetical protein
MLKAITHDSIKPERLIESGQVAHIGSRKAVAPTSTCNATFREP